MRWFRLWIDILDDPKLAVTVTSAETFRVTILLMAYARELDNAGKIDQPDDVIAWRLRIQVSDLKRHLKHLEDLKIIKLKPEICFINWDKRQFLSDDSTERVKRFRIKKGNVTKQLHETAPETETDTDTEQNKNIARSVFEALKAKVKTHRPNHPFKESLDPIEKLIRIDKYDPQEILKLVEWYPIGKPMIPEIFSTASLREKYDKLLSAYEREFKQKPVPTSGVKTEAQIRLERKKMTDEIEQAAAGLAGAFGAKP